MALLRRFMRRERFLIPLLRRGCLVSSIVAFIFDDLHLFPLLRWLGWWYWLIGLGLKGLNLFSQPLILFFWGKQFQIDLVVFIVWSIGRLTVHLWLLSRMSGSSGVCGTFNSNRIRVGLRVSQEIRLCVGCLLLEFVIVIEATLRFDEEELKVEIVLLHEED